MRVQKFEPLRQVNPVSGFGENDVLVVFGEVFARGYVNGLIDEAKKAGMKVIYGTVGRRDENEQLRPLTAEELAAKDQPLVNVPLECGFDMAKSSKGVSPCDQLKGLKLSEWNKATLDLAQAEESRQGRPRRFSRARDAISGRAAKANSGWRQGPDRSHHGRRRAARENPDAGHEPGLQGARYLVEGILGRRSRPPLRHELHGRDGEQPRGSDRAEFRTARSASRKRAARFPTWPMAITAPRSSLPATITGRAIRPTCKVLRKSNSKIFRAARPKPA